MVAGPAMAAYRKNVAKSAWDLPSVVFEKAEKRAAREFEAILGMGGVENAYSLHQELAETMLVDCTIERHNAPLDRVLGKIEEVAERSTRVGVTDSAKGKMNQGAQYVRHLNNMIVLARVIAQGARNRDESRGAHYKPDFAQRNDPDWMRTTLALHVPGAAGGHDSIRYVRALDYSLLGAPVHASDEVDVSLVKPRARKYETAGAASAAPSPGPPSVTSVSGEGV
jgi:succinate dehydrogenase / fumarate reductase flavoprotein subunit